MKKIQTSAFQAIDDDFLDIVRGGRFELIPPDGGSKGLSSVAFHEFYAKFEERLGEYQRELQEDQNRAQVGTGADWHISS